MPMSRLEDAFGQNVASDLVTTVGLQHADPSQDTVVASSSEGFSAALTADVLVVDATNLACLSGGNAATFEAWINFLGALASTKVTVAVFDPPQVRSSPTLTLALKASSSNERVACMLHRHLGGFCAQRLARLEMRRTQIPNLCLMCTNITREYTLN